MDSAPPQKPTPRDATGFRCSARHFCLRRTRFRFVEQRLAAHGRVFRSSVFGRKTVDVAGPELTEQFIDGSLVMREGSMPPHIQELFGGRSLPLLYGETHRWRKGIVLQGLSRAALSGYVPTMQRVVESYFDRWVGERFHRNRYKPHSDIR